MHIIVCKDGISEPCPNETSFIHPGGNTLQISNLSMTVLSFVNITHFVPIITRLNIQGNSLKTLPNEIFSLYNLEDMNASQNQLVKLNPLVGNLYCLKELHLSHNCISQLPQSLGRCALLTSLDVSHNTLRWFPSQIFNLNLLQNLFLEGNCFNILDVRLEKFSNPPSLVNIALQMTGTVLNVDPHTYCHYSKCKLEPTFPKSVKSYLFAPKSKLGNSVMEPMHSYNCLLHQKPLILNNVLELIQEDVPSCHSICSNCQTVIFHQGLNIIQLHVKCNIPIPVKYVFCSVSCYGCHQKQIRKKSVAGTVG